jgi:hypothetical protein
MLDQDSPVVEDNVIYANGPNGLDNGPNNTASLGVPSVTGNVICRHSSFELTHNGGTQLIAEGNCPPTLAPSP